MEEAEKRKRSTAGGRLEEDQLKSRRRMRETDRQRRRQRTRVGYEDIGKEETRNGSIMEDRLMTEMKDKEEEEGKEEMKEEG